jgi:nitrate/TMAO reductase-like tetraheme cytochrome c subunit
VANDPIVNPADLSAKASSQVCGQCHSIHSNLESPSLVQNQGHGFRPGRDLNETHQIWQRDSEVMREFLQRMEFEEGDEQALRRVFWNDGMVRVSGREFNGLIESACYQRGEMSCLSCHSMHRDQSDQRSLVEWADDQLSTAGLGDQACLQCHSAENFGVDHHHHSPQSAGARCTNCHLPHTSYGLLKAIRSHTISSPDIGHELSVGRPNACNLCHLDKTLPWSAAAMNKWYGKEIPKFTQTQTSVAAALLWLLQGDAGQRALAAWSMGWDDAQAASGTDWIAPLLAEGLHDPYDAVRFIARRSIRSLDGFQAFEFDALSPATVRVEAVQRIRDKWHQAADRPQRVDETLLLGEKGLLLNKLQTLQKDRDHTPIDLLE